MTRSRRRANRPDATTSEKLAAQTPAERRANQDVFSHQQLDRGERPTARTTRSATIAGVLVGALVAGGAWILISILIVVIGMIGSTSGSDDGGQDGYWASTPKLGADGTMHDCYQQTDENGIGHGTCYTEASQVPQPAWWTAQHKNEPADSTGAGKADHRGPGAELVHPGLVKTGMSLFAGVLVGLVVNAGVRKTIGKSNLLADTSDINQHVGDQHIATPEEIAEKFDWFPDAGAHSGVEVSSMISHVMLSRKGLPAVDVIRFAAKDDPDHDVLAGEVLTGDDGEPLVTHEPIIDETFGEDLFTASGLPGGREGRSLRKRFNASAVRYRPEAGDRDKLGDHKTVADLISADWHLPDYEPQRPAGAYLVDTAPVNTMVLAITRAGKGQTYIEPVIDMWSREDRPSNMVINDPKGELLVKFYERLVVRGFEPIQFNLINDQKTDIYNPLGLAAEAAREGDQTKCSTYVDSIADIFFPADAGDDPMWNNAASNAFKRAAYGLIDYYMEEERELRAHAESVDMDPEVLEQKLDVMWGHVTLYNCYQLFVSLSSKKLKSPMTLIKARDDAAAKAGEESDVTQEERDDAEAREPLWEGKGEADMLTLFFNATEALPVNMIRTLVANANNSLRSMAGAEKMLSSVYGIAITQMSFFTTPVIAALTSGRPSQNADLGGLSFPRRFGVRFGQNYVARHHLAGMRAVWSAYGDKDYTQPLGPDFDHADLIGRDGWARYYFKGIFASETAWLRLEIVNPRTGMLTRRLHFRFRKGHQLTLNGRHYVTEPVTGRKIVRGGTLVELVETHDDPDDAKKVTGYRSGHLTYSAERLRVTEDPAHAPLGTEPVQKETADIRAIISTSVRYSEQPKAVFMVTPPHLSKYAKLLLILIKQLVDLNFDKSYMTKSSQKPLYRTRFMLDELGNLQSDGHGISSFETMLSIGLGQEQQFTLILQTLQQLRSVYGEDVDKIVQGNVSNIIYLKSTDDAMIETLEKMSGKRHVSYTDSKTVSRDLEKMIGGDVDARVSYNMSTVEEPVITYNDMAFIPERNSIVLRAGDAPVWNRNETILPMSWRLFKNTIRDPGHDYSLQTIPTTSSTLDFDVRTNQPDFQAMLGKRMSQAAQATRAAETYKEMYDYEDVDIERLDPDVYADEVMALVTMLVNIEAGLDPEAPADPDYEGASYRPDSADVEDNTDVMCEAARLQADQREMEKKRYASGQVSRDDLVDHDGHGKTGYLDAQISRAYQRARTDMNRDEQYFRFVDGMLMNVDGSQVYIAPGDSMIHQRSMTALNNASRDPASRVVADAEAGDELRELDIRPAFYEFLASLETWEVLARGEFERAMATEMAGN